VGEAKDLLSPTHRETDTSDGDYSSFLCLKSSFWCRHGQRETTH